jgi:hypothetical protein
LTSPRGRTLQHMKRLASLAAAGAALSGTACSSSGYGVVDPLPPPPKCGDVAATIAATAMVRAGEGGAWRIELTLSKSTRTDVSYASAEPSVSNAILGSVTPGSDGSLVVVLTPQKSGLLFVSIPVDCPAGHAWVRAQIEIPSDASPGAAAKVTLMDSSY